MPGTERKSKTEIIADFGPRMIALLDQGSAVWDLSLQAKASKDLYRQRDIELGNFLIAREILNEEMGMTFIPITSVISTHPYEIPITSNNPQDYPDFLNPYSRNHLKVGVDLGPKRGGVVEIYSRLNDVRTSAPQKDTQPPERRITDSLGAIARLNVVDKIYVTDLDFIKRTVFEMIAINNERAQSKGQKREELEKLGDKMARERLLRFVGERRLPPEAIISEIQEDSKKVRLIITVQGIGDREFLYNPANT
jgi:hypothetical protein